jgi:aldose 1-epimerase
MQAIRKIMGVMAMVAVAVGNSGATADEPRGIKSQPFGKTADGTEVKLYTLTNARGMQVKITNYGGIVVALKAPDRNGMLGDVVLGYDHLEDYIKATPYFGSLIGRYGNRIAKGKFTLDGAEYTLATNNAPNHLHGGVKGFDKVVWDATPRLTVRGPMLQLRYVSKDGEEGYPGTLRVLAEYTLFDDDALRIQFEAKSDKPTIVNLTQHSYFNLACGGDILSHKVQIDAKRYTPVDETLIPTGNILPVEWTPFDFTTPHKIGERINDDNEQLKRGKGYDHNFVFDKEPGVLTRMARVTEPKSGRVLEIWSTEPGMQFYSGNFLDGTNIGKGGKAYQFRTGFCMEPQHYPDSPNQPNFPSTVLKPAFTYRNTILQKFSAE